MMKGRPILGVISGFLFGFFLGITLFMFGAIPLHSSLLWILPIVGIVLGLVMAAWAPFGKTARPAPTGASDITYAASGAATMTDVTVEEVATDAPNEHDVSDTDESESGTIEQ